MGVEVPSHRYVPAGAIIRTQAEANALPSITPDYPFARLNAGVVKVNRCLAQGYNAAQKETGR